MHTNRRIRQSKSRIKKSKVNLFVLLQNKSVGRLSISFGFTRKTVYLCMILILFKKSRIRRNVFLNNYEILLATFREEFKQSGVFVKRLEDFTQQINQYNI